MLKQYCGTTFKPELWIRIRHNKWIRIFLWSKIAIYLSVGLSQLQEKTSVLKREHPVLKKIKFINFLFLTVIFALLDRDKDPGTPLTTDTYPNPDPQH